MSKPFDAAMKHLVEAYPSAWLEYVGLPLAPAEVIDADLATVTASADKVIRVHTARPYLAHLEFQAGYDPKLGDRCLFYNVLLDYRHSFSVYSVVILLRREADGPAMTGWVRCEAPDGQVMLDFRYRVVRVWEKPAEAVLAGPLERRCLAPSMHPAPSGGAERPRGRRDANPPGAVLLSAHNIDFASALSLWDARGTWLDIKEDTL